jgi:hypothetical protein
MKVRVKNLHTHKIADIDAPIAVDRDGRELAEAARRIRLGVIGCFPTELAEEFSARFRNGKL